MPNNFWAYEDPTETENTDSQLIAKRTTNQLTATTQAIDDNHMQNQVLPAYQQRLQQGMQQSEDYYSAQAKQNQQVGDYADALSNQLSGTMDGLQQDNQTLQDQFNQKYSDLQDNLQKAQDNFAEQQQQQAPEISNDLPVWEQTGQPDAAQRMAASLPPPMPVATGTPTPADNTNYEDAAIQAAQKYGIDPDIFTAQIQQESGFNPNAKSQAGAIGIAQLMPSTASSMGIDPNDPLASLDAAAKLDKQNLDLFGGDTDKMLAAYNAGAGAVQQYGGIPPYDETQNYVKTISSSAQAKKAAAAQAKSGVSSAPPGEAQAAAQAIAAGATPADVAYAKAHLGSQDFIGLCEQFAENSFGKTGLFGSASQAWDSYDSNNQAVHGLKGVQEGDLVYFNDPTQPNGHVGVVTGQDKNGQPLFVSATNSGVREYGINDWEKLTGQSVLGYVPQEGAIDLQQNSNFVSPTTGSPANNQPNPLENMLPTWARKPLEGAGDFFSGLGNAVAPTADRVANSLHMALTGKPLDQTALDTAATYYNHQNPRNALTNYSDPMADLVNQGKNPLNPLAWGQYISDELLNSATQIVTGSTTPDTPGGIKTFGESALGKAPVVGGLIEQAADPVQDLLMVGTGALSKIPEAAKVLAPLSKEGLDELGTAAANGDFAAVQSKIPGLIDQFGASPEEQLKNVSNAVDALQSQGTKRLIESGLWGGVSAEQQSEQPNSSPATALLAGILGGAAPQIIHAALSKILGHNATDFVNKLAVHADSTPDAVAKDTATEVVTNLSQQAGIEPPQDAIDRLYKILKTYPQHLQDKVSDITIAPENEHATLGLGTNDLSINPLQGNEDSQMAHEMGHLIWNEYPDVSNKFSQSITNLPPGINPEELFAEAYEEAATGKPMQLMPGSDNFTVREASPGILDRAVQFIKNNVALPGASNSQPPDINALEQKLDAYFSVKSKEAQKAIAERGGTPQDVADERAWQTVFGDARMRNISPDEATAQANQAIGGIQRRSFLNKIKNRASLDDLTDDERAAISQAHRDRVDAAERQFQNLSNGELENQYVDDAEAEKAFQDTIKNGGDFDEAAKAYELVRGRVGRVGQKLMNEGDRLVYRGDQQPLEGGTLDETRFDPTSLYGPGAYFTDHPQVAAGYAIRPHNPGDVPPNMSPQAFLQSVRGLASRVRDMGFTDLADEIQAHGSIPVDEGRSLENSYLYQPLTNYISNPMSEVPDNWPEIVTDWKDSHFAAGANTRPAILPNDMNMFDVEQKSSPDEVTRITAALSPEQQNAFTQELRSAGYQSGISSNDLVYQALADSMRDFTAQDRQTDLGNAMTAANKVLNSLGYDGISYPGGKIRQLNDATGAPISHQAHVVFPESLNKVKNALTGERRGRTGQSRADQNLSDEASFLKALPKAQLNNIRNVLENWSSMKLTDEEAAQKLASTVLMSNNGRTIEPTVDSLNVYTKALNEMDKNSLFKAAKAGDVKAAQQAISNMNNAQPSDMAHQIASLLKQRLEPDQLKQLTKSFENNDLTTVNRLFQEAAPGAPEFTLDDIHDLGEALSALEPGTKKADINAKPTSQVKAGLVRLYTGVKAGTKPGEVFTDNLAYAKSVAGKDGAVLFADVDPDTITPLKTSTANRASYKLADDVASMAQPFTDKTAPLTTPKPATTPIVAASKPVSAVSAIPTRREAVTPTKPEDIKINRQSLKAIGDLVNAPYDVKQAVFMSMTPGNLASIAGALGGGIYGATQNPNDDLKAKVAKAVAFAVIGADVGHVVAGGRPSQMGQRMLNTWINNILGPGTPELKVFNDASQIATGPLVRVVTEVLRNRRYTAAGDILKAGFGAIFKAPTDLSPTLVRQLRDMNATTVGFTGGFGQFLHELNPSYIFRGPGLESLLEGAQPKGATQALLRSALSGDDDAMKQLITKLNITEDTGGIGQYSSSFTTRVLRGITFWARSILTAQELAISDAMRARGYRAESLQQIMNRVDRATLMNKETQMNAIAKAMYSFSGAITNRFPTAGRIAVPFRLIPANMLGQIADYTPGVGLLSELLFSTKTNQDLSTTLARQFLGTAGLFIGFMAFGGNVNGFGPTEARERATWTAAGNHPWTVRINGNEVSMKSLPPMIQGPLRMLGAIDDFHQFGGSASVPTRILDEYFSALGDHEFFPTWMGLLQTLQDPNNTDIASALQRAGGQMAGSIIPNPIATGVQATNPYVPDVYAKGLTPGQTNINSKIDQFPYLVKQAIASRTPGFNESVAPKILPGGEAMPNQSQGLASLLGTYRPMASNEDIATQAYTQANPTGAEQRVLAANPAGVRIGPMGVPNAQTMLSIGNNVIPMTQDEVHQYEQFKGQFMTDILKSVWPETVNEPVLVRQKILQAVQRSADQYARNMMIAQIAGSGSLITRMEQAQEQIPQQAAFTQESPLQSPLQSLMAQNGNG